MVVVALKQFLLLHAQLVCENFKPLVSIYYF